jgi:hypothetical protein
VENNMSDLTVLALDCAGTLFHPQYVTDPDNLIAGVPYVHSMGGGFHPIIRPSAIPFLKPFENHREIIVLGLTSGNSAQQMQALLQLDLMDYVNNVIGVNERNSVRSLKGDCRWVLIDDTDATRRDTEKKLQFMSGKDRSAFTDAEWKAFLDRHFIHCKTFFGAGRDPQPLTDFTDKVMSILTGESKRRD